MRTPRMIVKASRLFMYGGEHTAPNEVVSVGRSGDLRFQLAASGVPTRSRKQSSPTPTIPLARSKQPRSIYTGCRRNGMCRHYILVICLGLPVKLEKRGSRTWVASCRTPQSLGHRGLEVMPRLISSAVARVETRRSCLAKTLLCSTSAGKTARHYASVFGHATEY